jgi:hypothetical protein
MSTPALRDKHVCLPQRLPSKLPAVNRCQYDIFLFDSNTIM